MYFKTPRTERQCRCSRRLSAVPLEGTDAKNVWRWISGHASSVANMVGKERHRAGSDRRYSDADSARFAGPRPARGGRATHGRHRRRRPRRALVAEQRRVSGRYLRLRPAWRASRPYQHALSCSRGRQPAAPNARGSAGDAMGICVGRFSSDFLRATSGRSRRATLCARSADISQCQSACGTAGVAARG